LLIALLEVGILEVKYMKMKLCALLAAIGLCAGNLSGCGGKTPAVADTSAAAKSSVVELSEAELAQEELAEGAYDDAPAKNTQNQESGSLGDAVKDGMEPVSADALKDGVYEVRVDSSSGMFRITECELTVQDGAMSAVMTMSGTGYLKLYMGTGAEAEQASEADFIPFVENADGKHTFKVPVEALDKEINCSAFSRKKETWYDRVLVFCSGSLPAEAFADGEAATAKSLKLEDGSYTVAVRLEGGSGRASVETPAALRVEDGNAFAVITWGSSNYDYMKVDGERLDLISTGGNSSFEIPVRVFDRKMPVIADTIAMSEPHEVEYTLVFDSTTIKKAE
jgi:uncharacterized protein with FMN-binding domain